MPYMSDSQITEWLEQQGWARNPFTFRIYPGLMSGYEDEHRRVKNAIRSGSKFTLLLGETGAGKTNMLRRVQEEFGGGGNLFYMSKPPLNEEDLLSYMRDEVIQPGFISRYFTSYSLYNIHEAANERYADELVLLVDEGHEASTEVLEWLRTAIDHIDALTVVAAGLPSFEERLQEEVGTLYSRATDVVELESLGRDETIDLVRKRIEQVGGSSTDPFTQSALLKIYGETDGFPREVLRTCHECVVEAAADGKSIIDESDVPTEDESSDETNSPDEGGDEDREGGDVRSDARSRLTPKQRDVFDAVVELGDATSSELVDHIGLEEYKSRSHAIRSINNLLRRLMEQDVVERERRGRNYVYYPT